MDAVGRRLVDGDGDAERRILQLDHREPDHAPRIGGAVGAAQRLVDEGDERRALVRVGEDGRQRGARIAEPVGVRVARGGEDSERLGEVAQDAEIGGAEAHFDPRAVVVSPLEPLKR